MQRDSKVVFVVSGCAVRRGWCGRYFSGNEYRGNSSLTEKNSLSFFEELIAILTTKDKRNEDFFPFHFSPDSHRLIYLLTWLLQHSLSSLFLLPFISSSAESTVPPFVVNILCFFSNSRWK